MLTTSADLPADVCLILEGSWPYIPGATATWVQGLITSMPRLRFSVLYLGADPEAPRQRVYDIPGNVVEMVEVFLQDLGRPPAEGRGGNVLDDAAWAAIDACQRCLADGEVPDLPAVCAVLDRFPDRDALLAQIAYSPQAWNLAVQHCLDTAPHAPFLHHWWTGRLINATTLALLRTPLPRARIYHSASAGFAGLLGAKARQVLARPFILSEHGIYQRERRIELFDAGWIRGERRRDHLDLRDSQGEFKDRWARFFRALARTSYAAADVITTRSDAERACQMADGAEAGRSTVIPTGLDLAPFAGQGPRATAGEGPLRIGIVGPLTPARDVTSILLALGLLRQRSIPFTALCVVPPDEDPRHAAACRELVAGLGLADQLVFAGPVPVLTHYPVLDAVVATSLVEDIANTVLEACAAGLPVVATDVGACRELLLGRSSEDRYLGPAGLLVPPATPAAIADALAQLAADPAGRQALGAAGRERACRFYDRRDALHRYQEIYEELLDDAAAAAPVAVP